MLQATDGIFDWLLFTFQLLCFRKPRTQSQILRVASNPCLNNLPAWQDWGYLFRNDLIFILLLTCSRYGPLERAQGLLHDLSA